MLVGEKMHRNVACALPGDSLTDAFALMEERQVRHLPVADGGRLVGIISDRDLYRAPTTAKTVADVMTTSIVTCQASASLAEVAERMLALKIDSMPITDEGGRIVGIVTSSDILQLVARRDPLLMRAEPFWDKDVPESAI